MCQTFAVSPAEPGDFPLWVNTRQSNFRFIYSRWRCLRNSFNSNEHLNRDIDPGLCIHRILKCAKIGLDSQMLFDPFEKQFDLPATPIRFGDRQCGQRELPPYIGRKPAPLRVESKLCN